MKINIKLYLLIGLFVSIIFNVTLAIINDRLFLEELQIQKLEEMINSGEIQLNKGSITNIHLENDDIKWPWYSIIFYLAIYSAYWYMFSRIYRKKLPDDKWTLCLIIPAIMGIAALNPYYLFYMSVCYAGGKLKR